MSKTFLIEVVERDCPFCNKIHKLEKRKRIGGALIKKERVECEEVYLLCPESMESDECEFVSAELMDFNLQSARNAYRRKHGLLTSNEIAEIRGIYHLTQADFSLLLGWGEITITRYESKSIQDETYDEVLRRAKNDPYFVLEHLQKQRDSFSLEKYEAIERNVIARIEAYGVTSLNTKAISNKYLRFEKACEWNGYQVLNISKLKSVISFFSNYYGKVMKVKLMKLLWYVDALSFKRTGKAITGLVYSHMPYGALPIAHSEIIHLEGLNVEEIESDDMTTYCITSQNGSELIGLNSHELDILYQVANKFKSFSTKQIVEYMHEESAYINTEMYQLIPFSLCKNLRDF